MGSPVETGLALFVVRFRCRSNPILKAMGMIKKIVDEIFVANRSDEKLIAEITEELRDSKDLLYRQYYFSKEIIDAQGLDNYKTDYVIREILQTKLWSGRQADELTPKNIEFSEILKYKKKQMILELICSPEDNLLDIQYCLLLLHYLFDKKIYQKIDYSLLISGPQKEGVRYTDLGDNQYFRISHQLYFYGFKENTPIKQKTIFQKILLYHHIENKKGKLNDDIYSEQNYYKSNWIHAAHSIESSKKKRETYNFGRIIPHIPINKDSYLAMMDIPSINNYSGKDNIQQNFWHSCFDKLILGYKEKIGSIINPSYIDLNLLIGQDCYIEQLLFLSFFYHLLDTNQEYAEKNIVTFHEDCMTISQAIMQLIENVIIHALGKEDDKGAGIFSIRIRNSCDASRLYVSNLNHFDDVKYFVELYISDVQYNNFSGIVDTFKRNVAGRMETALHVIDEKDDYFSQIVRKYNEKIADIWKNELKDDVLSTARFHYSQLCDPITFKLSENAPIKELLKNDTCDYLYSLKGRMGNKRLTVMLRDFFEENQCIPLEDYLTAKKNIAFHYGLQILNSIIRQKDGYLYVCSGNDEKDQYEQCNEFYKKADKMTCSFGTSYVIYLPIKERENISYIDVPFVLGTEETEEYISKFYKYDRVNLSRINPISDKEIFILVLFNSILEQFTVGDEECCKYIGVVDCNTLIESIHEDNKCTETLVYEIIAKSLFLYLASEYSVIENIAIVNLDRPYDVIKVFRQFALFFGRTGENRVIRGGKSVFLVDKNGEADILFYGNSISSIKANLASGKLYGGSNQLITDILETLAGGYKNE